MHAHIPSFAGRHKLPEVHRSEIQPKYSLDYSTEVVVQEPISPTKGLVFLSSTREKLSIQELEVPSEEEEKETYYNIPLVEEPK